ncbi:alpha/beta hydrolase [Dokdonella sp.]|uniref:alpha/beta fold hydrolase n=1 Tax=Dokdonella sp. TaxID=2291710 RepID=UPI001B23E025|nr:alpha/beta hydrolase [Dokdonella sp.]MBO9661473.1 alpha/beta hydrolase [Dokdonella sp.]
MRLLTVVLASFAPLVGAAPAPAAKPAPDTALDVYAEPAQRIDIGAGRHVNLRCSGSGAPTVILDAGQGMTSMSWRKLQPLVAKTNRVCAYDRAGLGFSDPGPLPRTAQAAAADLSALVHAAELAPPLVLVGHSMASYVARLYAAEHPGEVAGLVLVDPVSETLAEDAPGYAAREAEASAKNTDYGKQCAEAARKGDLDKPTPAAQACVPPPIPGLSDKLSDSILQRFRTTTYWDTALSERAADAANIAAVKAAQTRSLAKLPLIVLSAENREWIEPHDRKIAEAAYAKAHRRIAALSTRGRVEAVAKSGHNIQEDRPEAVAKAIAEVMREVSATKAN